MSKLTPVEHQGQRVLTTSQLAESFGTDGRRVSENFNANKDRYVPGKHYFVIEGDELKQFGNQYANSVSVSRVSKLYLWSEKGAWMHAKSLNTDQAWEAYEMLIDDYYSVKQKSLPPMTGAEMLAAIATQALEQDRRLSAVEDKQEHITEVLSLNPTEWRSKVNALINKIAIQRGGHEAYQDVRNESYDQLEERAKCKLSIRVTNIQKGMAFEGVSKSKVDKVTKMDAIAQDARLTEIYLAIVKEMAIRYKIDPK
ncbi:ORF6N domain-containing protein [Paenibacillus sp. L3-i20]|uniref:ORF6N domain-containing protein n=1 Tax=Paenibacillus sp. L3-i20 TaxID=2905833 RepID=UPI001EDFF20B|nr:ORF6N domain-containing protein [Paenibacillus sp. L3-i20]GKU79821.1 hypothetical protein L3i20_v242180 [Paenibacillus sp. L3-i20]